jgi:hypothetical protein
MRYNRNPLPRPSGQGGEDVKHRKNGPAVEFANGNKMWYLFGVIHRENGPAYEGADDQTSYWFDGSVVPVKTLRQFKA